MRHIQLIIVLTALTSQTTFARCPRMARSNPMMAALQNIFTSGYNMPMQTRNRRLPTETGKPLPYMRNVQQKCPCQPESPCSRVLPEMRVPEILKMQEIMRQEARVPEIRMPVQMITEMPKQYVSNMPMGSVITSPARLVPEVMESPLIMRNMPEIVMPIIQERFECPCASPKALVNPFLPAASPVSAYAPSTSNLLPPATPNTGRNQFLRKIPIPPPTL